MNKTNKILLAVVVLLIIMFGVGEFFASSTMPSSPANQQSSSGAASPSPAAANLTATNIVKYVPQPASSTPMESGSCWTNSIAAPFRSDAWRCTVGNNISDPCFEIPGSKNLLCGMNPADPAATSTFVLKLTKPLPQGQSLPGTAPTGWAWLVELQDGTLCSPFTGTRPFTANGEAASYGCAPGPLGKELDIFNMNTSSSLWTAEVGTLGAAPANSTSGLPVITSSSTIPIATVWQ